MPEEGTQSQVAEPAEASVSPEGEPQAPEAGEGAIPGAEREAAGTVKTESASAAAVAPRPKTYTQAELDAVQGQLMAAKDREIQQHRDALAQVALREQVARIQASEAQAQAKDRADIDAGVITENEAQARAQARFHTLQVQAQAQREQSSLEQMRQQGEGLARVLYATDLAREYGINADLLIKDKALTTTSQMLQKAFSLAMKAKDERIRAAEAKRESFDKGPQAETTGPGSEDQRLRARYPSMYKT